MPLVDVVLLLGAGMAVISVAGWLGLKLERRRQRDDERRGRDNAERLRQEESRRCTECDRPCDPAVDVFDHDAWWCKACWLKIIH